MTHVFSARFNQALERPGWQWGVMLSLGCGCLCVSLYFLMLRTPLQQQSDEKRQGIELQLNVQQQMRALLLQPPLADILRQHSVWRAQVEERIPLLDTLSEPLRVSKSTLLQWQPLKQGTTGVINSEVMEKGELTLTSDFSGLLVLLRNLLAGPAAPALSELELNAQDGVLDVRFSLAAEERRVQVMPAFEPSGDVVRDPFSAAAVASCPDVSGTLSDVVLGGVIGHSEQWQGWMLWPGLGWQKAAVGWRDEQTGWEVGAVESAQVIFDLHQPSCVVQQHRLSLYRQ